MRTPSEDILFQDKSEVSHNTNSGENLALLSNFQNGKGINSVAEIVGDVVVYCHSTSRIIPTNTKQEESHKRTSTMLFQL